MKTNQLTSRVTKIKIKSIRVNPENPRGSFRPGKDLSFDRLVSSVAEWDVLVPIVVRKLARHSGEIEYELLDGERRFRAAKKTGRKEIPAHVLDAGSRQSELRKIMFHLHMTREQWGPWAQCLAIAKSYPEIDRGRGILFSEKEQWTRKLHEETGTPLVTARDRVRILCWPKSLRQEIEKFMSKDAYSDVYSYILAIEASIIEPSVKNYADYYSLSRESKINRVREAFLRKTIRGIESGVVESRDVIRSVSPLFSKQLSKSSKVIAMGIFRKLVRMDAYGYQDATSEMDVRIEELRVEKPPSARKLLSQIQSLTEILDNYRLSFVKKAAKRLTTQEQLRKDLVKALNHLSSAATKATNRLRRKL